MTSDDLVEKPHINSGDFSRRESQGMRSNVLSQRQLSQGAALFTSCFQPHSDLQYFTLYVLFIARSSSSVSNNKVIFLKLEACGLYTIIRSCCNFYFRTRGSLRVSEPGSLGQTGTSLIYSSASPFTTQMRQLRHLQETNPSIWRREEKNKTVAQKIWKVVEMIWPLVTLGFQQNSREFLRGMTDIFLALWTLLQLQEVFLQLPAGAFWVGWISDCFLF